MSAKHKHVTSYTIDLTYESKQEGIEAYRREIAKLEYDFHSDFPNISLYSPNEEIEALVKDKIEPVSKEICFYFTQFREKFYLEKPMMSLNIREIAFNFQWEFYKFYGLLRVVCTDDNLSETAGLSRR